MVELSALDVEKLIHLFVQNLTFKISSNCNKKLDKINFMPCIDVASQTNLELLRIGEKSKDITINNTLDIDNVQSVRYFIETQTKFLDKFVYPINTLLLTCYLDNINKKIVQKVNETDKNIIERNTRCYNKSSYLKKQKLERIISKNNQQICNANVTETILVPQWIHGDLVFVKRTNTCLKKSDFIESIAEHTWQEAILNEEYLQLYINNVEFMKNVHVTLYVSSKVI